MLKPTEPDCLISCLICWLVKLMDGRKLALFLSMSCPYLSAFFVVLVPPDKYLIWEGTFGSVVLIDSSFCE